MQLETMQKLVLDALDDLKAKEVVTLDVTRLTTITDLMIICSGTSSRHVKSLADNVIKTAKENGISVLGVQGQETGEWVLVDLADIIVHIMQMETREHYQLEQLWSIDPDQEIMP